MSVTRRDFIAGFVALGAGTASPQSRRGSRRASSESASPPLAANEAEKQILGVIDTLDREGRTYLSVPAQDGRWLRVLTEISNAQHVVEVGTSTGYSGLWLALALRNTGGRLTTFEIDTRRAGAAREHFKQAGVGALVTVVDGDAHQELKKLRGSVDVAFIDADKEGYVDYLNQLEPRIRAGGLLLAHNVGMVRDYVQAVTSNPAFDTVFYLDGAGLGVTVKKRTAVR